MSVDPTITLLARLAITLLFAHAAWHKFRDMDTFTGIMASYELLAPGMVRFAAPLLMATELTIAVGSLANLPAALSAAALLLVLYAGAMATNLLRDRKLLDCGCGGPAQPISWWLVMRNGLLAALALAALLPVESRDLDWMDLFTVGGTLLVLTLLYAAANMLHAARAELEEWV